MWKKILNFIFPNEEKISSVDSKQKSSNPRGSTPKYEEVDINWIEEDDRTEVSLDFGMYDGVNFKYEKCPYCNFKFEKIPKRKRKCPSCKNPVYKRTHTVSKKPILVTEDDKEIIDERKSQKSFLLYWVDQLDGLGFPKQASHKFRAKLKSESESPLENDIIWSAFNKLLNRKIETGADHHSLKMIHYNMALFLQAEGKDFNYELAQSNKHKLLDLKSSRGLDSEVTISGVGNNCTACIKDKNKIYSIREALSEMPLPCGGKTENGDDCFCMCSYRPHFNI